MQRRHLAGALLALPVLARPASTPAASPDGDRSPWADIEAPLGGRLGVALWDSGRDRWWGQRLDERFPLCSTFKWLLAAWALAQAADGRINLQERLRWRRADLLPYSPVTSAHAGRTGLRLATLCEAAVTTSDNTAANLLLDRLGGPAGLTAYARHLGDDSTRLDRPEPLLNTSAPGDPRDTTTPRGMARALRAALVGEALPPAQRAQLKAWMVATRTGRDRLRAGLPGDWVVGDKTGTGDGGCVQDVAVVWPPGRAPWVLVAYQQGSPAPMADLKQALVDVARVAARVGA